MRHLLLSCIFGLGLALMLLALLGRWLPTQAHPAATTRYVATDGNDTGDCATIGGRCRTIQYAVNVATPFDEIWVGGGTYTGTGPEVVSVTMSIALLGGWDGVSVGVRDPAAYPTILDGENARRVILITKMVSPTVDGFVIARGNAASAPFNAGKGGGIHINRASPLIANNVITSNVAYTSASNAGYGGGIYIASPMGATVITGNQVLFNVANTASTGYGGGLYIDGGSANQVVNNVVLSNTASITGGAGYGGGVGFSSSPNAMVIGNRVEGNIAQGGTATSFASRGGGIYCQANVSATIGGNIIQYNIASVLSYGTGGGVGGSYCHRLAVVDNVLQGNIGSASLTEAEGRGGALGVYFSHDLWLDANWVLSNTASYGPWGYGGGLYLSRDTSFTMTNNIVAANHASYQGGGLAFQTMTGEPVTGVLAHNTFAANDQGGGDGRIAIFLNDDRVTLALTNNLIYSHTYGLYATTGSTATLDHTLFYGNASGDTGGSGLVVQTSSITGQHPLLSADYHLLQGSPAINAGVAIPWIVTDIDGQSRPEGAAPDIGADEYREWRIFLPLILRQ